MKITDIPQTWPNPKRPRPIVLIGAGGIVRAAHLPSYRRAGFPVIGIYDLNSKTARETAKKFNISRVFSSIAEAVHLPGVIFDAAVPPESHLEVLRQLPNRAAVLIQKPLGLNLKETRKILALCRKKKLTAAVNFQARYSPNMAVIRRMMEKGLLGRVTDLEIRVNLYTPWAKWKFLFDAPRLELVYHSIHYLDLIRSFLGEPKDVYCRLVRHPQLKRFSEVGNSTILNYGPWLRCSLYTNHCFTHGPRHAMAQLKIEGTLGAAVAHMEQKLGERMKVKGLDRLEVSFQGSKWKKVRLQGDWFPDAFQGTMANLQRYVSGEDKVLNTRVEDAAKTMALVEACYISSRQRGTPLPKI